MNPAPVNPAFQGTAALDSLDHCDSITQLAMWIGALCNAIPHLRGKAEEATALNLGHLGSSLADLLIAHQEAAWAKSREGKQ